MNNSEKNRMIEAMLTFFAEFQLNSQVNIKQEVVAELEAKMLPTKLFYSLKEVSHITGLSIRAIKERYRRGTLQVVYDNVTPLIPADSLNELVEKLNRQIINKRRAA